MLVSQLGQTMVIRPVLTDIMLASKLLCPHIVQRLLIFRRNYQRLMVIIFTVTVDDRFLGLFRLGRVRFLAIKPRIPLLRLRLFPLRLSSLVVIIAGNLP